MRVTLTQTEQLRDGRTVTRRVDLDGDPGEVRAALTGRQPSTCQRLAWECERQMKAAILERSGLVAMGGGLWQ